MAGLAAHIDIRPGGFVGLGLDVVVFLEVGRMALSAHAVPVLARVGPVEPVRAGPVALFRIEMIPSLPFHIPGNGETLEPAARKGHQVLLQRIPAESVGDFEFPHAAARPLGMDEKFAVFSVKFRDNPIVFECSVVEIAKDRLFGRHFHGVVVVGPFPQVVFPLVAGFALLTANEDRPGHLTRALRCCLLIMKLQRGDRDGDDNEKRCEESCYFPTSHLSTVYVFLA